MIQVAWPYHIFVLYIFLFDNALSNWLKKVKFYFTINKESKFFDKILNKIQLNLKNHSQISIKLYKNL